MVFSYVCCLSLCICENIFMKLYSDVINSFFVLIWNPIVMFCTWRTCNVWYWFSDCLFLGQIFFLLGCLWFILVCEFAFIYVYFHALKLFFKTSILKIDESYHCWLCTLCDCGCLLEYFLKCPWFVRIFILLFETNFLFQLSLSVINILNFSYYAVRRWCRARRSDL